MRAKESSRRKEWSKKHGSDSYDTSGCGNIQHDSKKKIGKKFFIAKKSADKKTLDIQDINEQQ